MKRRSRRGRDAGPHQKIAQAMCDAATEILWPHARGWIRHRRPRAEFVARPGRGLKTYCRIEPNDRFLLNFGTGMVQSKLQGTECVNWTTGIEISERGYYQGRLTPINLFAATCLHEHAHMIDHVRSSRGRRLNRRHHDSSFYEILDRMHTNPVANDVRDFLEDRFRQEGMPDTFDDGRSIVTESLALMRSRYRRGQRVTFTDRNGTEIIGRVVRINRMTITMTVEAAGGPVTYRVPIGQLRSAEKVSI